jgi:heat shock protein HtpX
MSLLGVEPWLNANGLNLTSLLIFAAVFGFGGAFISLALSKWMAKKSVGAKVIVSPSTPEERWFYNLVERQSQTAGIKMPEIAIYDSPEVNAFATGMSRNASLVAVSSGLLHTMTPEEAEAVIGHEISHVANGDMVTLTLIQGVVNTFVIFFARIIGYTVDKVIFKTENGHGPAFFISMIVSEIILGILASMIVMWFSRQREFRADQGGAQLTHKSAMIAALKRLQMVHQEPLPDKLAAFGISGGGAGSGFIKLFMTHPPLEERIAALENS